jgi:hypothetical protein
MTDQAVLELEAPAGLPELVLWVAGRPQTAGSKRAVPTGAGMRVIESGSAGLRRAKAAWRSDLRDAGERARRDVWRLADPTDAALEVLLVFVRSRPGAHLRTGRMAGVVKDAARSLRPTARPDVVKLARAAEDALTGVLWADDAQIVDERLAKVYGDQVGRSPRAEGLLLVVSEARSVPVALADVLAIAPGR